MFKYKTLPIGIELSKWFYETSITLTNYYESANQNVNYCYIFKKYPVWLTNLPSFFHNFLAF